MVVVTVNDVLTLCIPKRGRVPGVDIDSNVRVDSMCCLKYDFVIRETIDLEKCCSKSHAM